MELVYNKSQSTVRPDTVDTTSSKTTVYLRRNIKEITSEDSSFTTYEYEEAKLTKEEYDKYCQEQLSQGTEVVDIEAMTLDEYKLYKKKEISDTCKATIFAGFDVELSNGTKHISLTYDDQINMLVLNAELDSGATEVRYHADGEDCEYFSAEDMLKIIQKSTEFKTYHTTYCNQLNMTIMNDCATKEEVAAIYYGIPLNKDRNARLVELTGISSITD